MRTQTAIDNAKIMIEAVKIKSPSHPYVAFLDDFIEVINLQDELLKEQEVNVSQCFKTSLLFKSQSNASNKKLLESDKKVLSLEARVKELEEMNDKLKEGL